MLVSPHGESTQTSTGSLSPVEAISRGVAVQVGFITCINHTWSPVNPGETVPALLAGGRGGLLAGMVPSE